MLLFPLGWARAVDYVGVGKTSQVIFIHKGEGTPKATDPNNLGYCSDVGFIYKKLHQT